MSTLYDVGSSSHCLDKTLTQQLQATGLMGWGTPRTVLLTGAKKSHLGCRISFELPTGFQYFVVINKINPLKKYLNKNVN